MRFTTMIFYLGSMAAMAAALPAGKIDNCQNAVWKIC